MNNQEKIKKNKDFEIYGDYSVDGKKYESSFEDVNKQEGGNVESLNTTDGINTEVTNNKGTQKELEETNGITVDNGTDKADSKPPLYDEESDSYAVRQSLENAGITDIEWDDGKVVSHGVSLVPTVNKDGTTYAKKDELDNYIYQVKDAQGDPLVRVNEYNNKYGMTGLIGFDDTNKRLTVDGNEVSYAYIDGDGNAWASRQALDFAYDDAARRRNIKSPDELLNQYKENAQEAQSQREQVASNIKGWDFTYEDLKNDPVYNTYKEMYMRDGMRAYNNAINDMAARNGGNLSSAAIGAAGANFNRYLERMNEVVPEIANMAYNRFMTGQQYDYKNSEKIEEDAYRLFSMAYNTSRDSVLNQQKTEEDSFNRFLREEQLDSLYSTNEFNEAYNNERLKSARQAYEVSVKKAALEEARALGYYTDETAAVLGVGKDEFGNYPSVNKAEIDRQLELYNNVQLPQIMKEIELQRDEYNYKLSASFYDSIIREAYKRTGRLPDTTDYFELFKWAMEVVSE